MDIWLAVAIIIAGGIILGSLYLFVYFYMAEKAAAKSGITDPDKLAQFKVSYTSTLAQIIGGVAVVATFAWTFIKDSKTLQQTAAQSANQQYIDAVNLLDAAKAQDVNAAGMYSFKKLVDTYPEYYTPTHNTMMSFISTHQPDLNYPAGTRPPRVTEAIRAATYVLGILAPQDGPLQFVDYYLAGASFANASSLENADFRNAKLFAVNFTSAHLAGAKFNGAAMSDWESFGWENNAWDERLAKARSGNDGPLQWSDERFRYIIDFDNADLTGAHFENTSVDGGSFRSATLNGASFAQTDISRADFRKAKNLDQTNFDGACYGGETEKPLGLEGLEQTIRRKVRDNCNSH
jgi:uncharacterized protein YjbI with pentapeptide repeats